MKEVIITMYAVCSGALCGEYLAFSCDHKKFLKKKDIEGDIYTKNYLQYRFLQEIVSHKFVRVRECDIIL